MDPTPRLYKGVMISSTFADLKEHRAALREAIERQGFKDVVMENDTAKADVDLIDSSLQMVREFQALVRRRSPKNDTTKCFGVA